MKSIQGPTFGAGDADGTLVGDTFELFRAIHGRRSVDQVREMKWEGDPEKVIPAFWWFTLHPADAPINE